MNQNIKSKLLNIFIILILSTIVACGRYGPLYLEKEIDTTSNSPTSKK